MKTVRNEYPRVQWQGISEAESRELWRRRIFSVLQEYRTWSERSTIDEIGPHLDLLRELQLEVGKAVSQAEAKANELSKQTAADAASHTAANAAKDE